MSAAAAAGRTFLVTGGAGFIGSNFVRRHLARFPDDRVLVLDALTYAGNPDNLTDALAAGDRFEFWYGDVCNPEVVESLVARADVVVHFAAESHVARSIFDNRVFFMTDVIGTQTIANAVLKNQATVERFVHISTSEVYGTAETVPMTESHPLNPMSPYASAKAGADRLVYSYVATYDIPAVIVRPFNNYGPYQHLEKVVPRFITSALKGEPLTVHGDGSARRDWINVTDCCDAIEAVVAAPLTEVRGEVFHAASGEVRSVIDIARAILERLDRPGDLLANIEDRPGQVQHHAACVEKTAEVLGWRAAVPFEEGLDATIAWYRDNPEWWSRLEWMKSIPIKLADGSVVLH